MQRVVRSTLVGLLALAGLTACGDKVTVPPATTPVQDNTVHNVTVTPSTITLPVGGTAVLGVAVDAGSGVTDKSVTWSSSDATVASVDNSGKVTAIKGGVVTIKATANADHSTSGAAVVTVSAPGSVVHSVTIVPPTMTLNQGQAGSFAATVNADAGVTNLGVTWSSSDTTIATIDANGNATASALKAGTVTIRATSKADPTVSGVAALTVVGGAGNTPVVTISSLTTLNPGGTAEIPANLSNVNGQLNVYLNVDANGATLKSVSATLTCGSDVVTQTQTIGSNKIGASAAAGQVTFSFNTAAFDSTGKAALHNGTCSVSAQAATAAGTQSATTSTTFTLNNADAVYGSISAAKTATDAGGLTWGGGDVTVKIVPVFYTAGRSAVSSTVTLSGTATVGGGALSSTQSATTFPATVTFPASKASGVSGGVKGVTDTAVTAKATFVDNTGNTFNATGTLSNAGSLGLTRVDNQGPTAGAYAFNTQGTSNNWLGTAFVFNSAAGNGYTPVANNDNGGVDQVTVAFQYSADGGATWTTVTKATDIPQSNTNTVYKLRFIETDALGNSTTTGVAGTFGVDVSAPKISLTGVTKNAIVTTTADQGTASITDDFSGPNGVFVAVTRQNTGITANNATSCVIGTATASSSGYGSIPTYDPSGAITGYCKPVATASPFNIDASGAGYYNISAYGTDNAGNVSTDTTVMMASDNVNPVQGGVSIPSSITGGTTVSFPTSATDNMDLVRADGLLAYGGVTDTLYYSNTLPGVAFDNVLTNSASYSLAISNFITSLQVTAAGAPQAPAGGNDRPTQLTVTSVDEAGNVSNAVPVTFGAATFSTATSFTTNAALATWTDSSSKQAVCGAASDTCSTTSNPATTNLSAFARGPSGQLNIPFTTVAFYYTVDAGKTMYPIGAASAPVATDNGVTRTWTYTLSSFNPPAKSPQGVTLAGHTITIYAIGQDGSGNALVATPLGQATITLTAN